MKHVKLFEEFIGEKKDEKYIAYVNESVQVEKTQHGDASIGWKGKEVVFSSDKETIGAVAKALINLQQERTSLGTKVTKGINWMSIDSAQGDVYMERKPGSSTIMLKQSEEFSHNAVEFDIPASEVNNIVKKLQALHEGRIALNHVYANAPIRNKVLEILKNGKVTEQDFMDAVSKSGAPSKWISRNSHFFKVEEEDGVKYYSLSKSGQVIMSAINESALALEESSEPKVGDTLTMVKNGKKGKVISCSSDMCQVDFGNGDVYGIVYRRIKGNKIIEGESLDAEDILEVYEEFGIEENLVVDPLDLTTDLFYVSINGKVYGYKAKSGDDIQDVASTFKKMLKYSAGKALAWLKRNTELAMGAGGTGPLRESAEEKLTAKDKEWVKSLGNDKIKYSDQRGSGDHTLSAILSLMAGQGLKWGGAEKFGFDHVDLYDDDGKVILPDATNGKYTFNQLLAKVKTLK